MTKTGREVVTVNGEAALWESIADSIREDIAAGRLKPGDTLPSEKALEERSGLSRTTVRRALLQLVSEGLLTEGRSRQGRRVADRRPVTMPFAQSETQDRADQRREHDTDAWVADVADQGRVASQKLKVSIDPADAAVARRLELAEGDPVVVRSHVRTVDGEAHNLSSTYYAESVAEGTLIMVPRDIPQGVILYMLDELGISQDWFYYEFEARMPTPEETRELRIPSGIPVLVQWTTGCTADRKPVKLTVTTWPADRARLADWLPG